MDKEKRTTAPPFKLKPAENPWFKCPFPGCVASFQKEEGKPNACKKHRELITDVLFILDNTTFVPGQPGPEQPPGTGPDQPPPKPGPKIFVPKPGMGDRAIQEARAAAGKQPPR